MLNLQKNDNGRALFDKVCTRLDLIERDYFGLTYTDDRGPSHLKVLVLFLYICFILLNIFELYICGSQYLCMVCICWHYNLKKKINIGVTVLFINVGIIILMKLMLALLLFGLLLLAF